LVYHIPAAANVGERSSGYGCNMIYRHLAIGAWP
jgi:hypothetical protein